MCGCAAASPLAYAVCSCGLSPVASTTPVGVVALIFIVGGLIGGVILIWRLAVAAWYIPLTIYRLLNVGRVGVAEIDEE